MISQTLYAHIRKILFHDCLVEKNRAKIIGLQNKNQNQKQNKTKVFFASDVYRKTLNKTSTDKCYSVNINKPCLSQQKTPTKHLNI